MIVRPYEQYDETRLSFDTSQSYMTDYLDSIDFGMLSQMEESWTAEHDGKVIAMGGLIPIWQGRAQAWMFMSPESGKHMRTIHKAVVKGLNRAPFKRIESTVTVGFKPGTRWMKMLGFELEGYMKAYSPDGLDMLLYARIKR